jgi:hypothetical protein
MRWAIPFNNLQSLQEVNRIILRKNVAVDALLMLSI